MNTLRFLLLVILFCGITVLSVVVYRIECDKRQAKEDLIELSGVKYGLFSVDEWKGLLATIVSHKLEAFDLEGSNKQDMRRRISEFLTKFLRDFEQQYYAEKSKSIGGLIQSGIASLTGTFEKMKKDVPVITERILEFMNDPRNRDAIRSYIIDKLDEYADETFSEIDYTRHDQIIAAYGEDTRTATVSALHAQIHDTKRKQRPFVIALFVLIMTGGILLLASRQLSQPELILYITLCFVLLLAGLLLPMIEIDARISDLKFSFLGESISFKDQVLYYKSKSILEVVQLMVTQSRVDLLLVGVLVLAFSVLFPMAKLICSVIFVFNERIRENRFIRFIVFKTGKWSMADVMVVAIFMAYIGFSGIIGEQLAQLQRITDNVELLTTNQSCLLIGFYLFTSFAVLSLLVSHQMQHGRGMGDG